MLKSSSALSIAKSCLSKAAKPNSNSPRTNGPFLLSKTTKRSIVTDYDKSKLYANRSTYTAFPHLERARSIRRKSNIGANVIGVRMQRPLHLDQLKDAMDYVQVKFPKLQYSSKTLVEQGGGVYLKLNSGLPLEIEEKVDGHDEEQLHLTMESYLRKPLMEHQMETKVIFGRDSCDLVVAVSNGAADVASTGALVNEVLKRYWALVDNPTRVETSTEVAPMIDEYANIFPPSTRTSFLSWRGVAASMREFKRMTTAVANQSPYRLDGTLTSPSFLAIELSPELTSTLKRNAAQQGIDVLSMLASAILLAAKQQLFKLSPDNSDASQPLNIDMWINYDLRTAAFRPPLPVDTLSVAEVEAYHCVSSGTSSEPRSVWEVAKDIQTDVSAAIETDRILDAYHYATTLYNVQLRKIETVPQAPFVFQDAGNLGIEPYLINQLGISDVRLAETAFGGQCKLLLSTFNGKLQLSFNFSSSGLSSSDAEALTDAALDLIRKLPAAQQE